MIVANNHCQHAADVALSLSQRRDIVFNADFSPFRGLFRTILDEGLLSKSPPTWTEGQLVAFRNAVNSDLALIEYYSALAEQERKPLVVMVHPGIIANPGISGWAGHEMSLSEAYRRSPVGRRHLHAANTANTTSWNWTMLTDDYLCSWRMVFVFEHPLDSVTHTYRLIRESFNDTLIGCREIEPLLNLYSSLDSTRALLRFCLGKSQTNLAPQPLIIHKYDLNHGENGVIGKVCEALRLEKPSVPQRELQGGRRMSVEAAGVELFQEIGEEDAERYVSGEISEWEARLEMKLLKWEVEFGQHTAGLLREQARSAMPSYNAFANYCVSV